MCLSYIGHRWPIDMDDPIEKFEWELEKREREDLCNLLMRPWTSIALTDREQGLWAAYLRGRGHQSYRPPSESLKRMLEIEGYEPMNMRQFLQDDADQAYLELVASLRERGLV